MKKKILNIVIYGFLLVALGSFAFLSLPQEIRAKFPQLTRPVALIVGVVTGGGGSFALYLNAWYNKHRNEVDDQVRILLDKVLETQDKYDNLEKRYLQLEHNVKETTKVTMVTNKLLDGVRGELSRTNQLHEASLESKLKNPFIDPQAREKIEGVINEKKPEII